MLRVIRQSRKMPFRGGKTRKMIEALLFSWLCFFLPTSNWKLHKRLENALWLRALPSCIISPPLLSAPFIHAGIVTGQFSREWDEEKTEARDAEDEIMDVNSHLLYSIARLTVHRTAAMHRAMYHLVRTLSTYRYKSGLGMGQVCTLLFYLTAESWLFSDSILAK